MKYERDFQDLAYGSLFIIFLIGFYLVQHECVKIVFEGMVGLFNWIKHL